MVNRKSYTKLILGLAFVLAVVLLVPIILASGWRLIGAGSGRGDPAGLTGFGKQLVRINNQIDYTLFGKSNIPGIIIGENRQLFESGSLRAWYGQDYAGEDTIALRMRQLKVLQDTLSLRGKTFALVITAGKGTALADQLPESSDAARGKTNYETYLEYAAEYGITLLDFNRYFRDNKDYAQFPLFSRQGSRWSHYGACLAADSILRFIENSQNIDLPGIKWFVIDLAEAKGPDYDLGSGLNLIFKLKRQKMAYPRIYYEPEAGKVKPSILLIGDTSADLFHDLNLSNAFSGYDFLSYNPGMLPDSINNPFAKAGSEILELMNEKDAVILLCGEANLGDLGWGFIRGAYEVLYERYLQAEVANLATYIRSDRNWMNHIREKAAEWGLPVDSVVMIDANWGVRENR